MQAMHGSQLQVAGNTQGLTQHEIDYNRNKTLEELKNKPRIKLDFL